MKQHAPIPSVDEYEDAFNQECAQVYPAITAIERAAGFATNQQELNELARILACPVKANPPNWQHGRVLYALLCQYIDKQRDAGNDCRDLQVLDIGTAKGFSAVVLAAALTHAIVGGRVVSIDIVDPHERVRRNSVLEAIGKQFYTVPEFVEQALLCLNDRDRCLIQERIDFKGGGALPWLEQNEQRINFAFVDGKHTYEAVACETAFIALAQYPGDICVFDDCHLPNVRDAVVESKRYDTTFVQVNAKRAYMIGVRR